MKGILVQLDIEGTQSGWFYLSFENNLYLTEIYDKDFQRLFDFDVNYPNQEPEGKAPLQVTLGSIVDWFSNHGHSERDNRIPAFVISEAIRFAAVKIFVQQLLKKQEIATEMSNWWNWHALLTNWRKLSISISLRFPLHTEHEPTEKVKICGIQSDDVLRHITQNNEQPNRPPAEVRIRAQDLMQGTFKDKGRGDMAKLLSMAPIPEDLEDVQSPEAKRRRIATDSVNSQAVASSSQDEFLASLLAKKSVQIILSQPEQNKASTEVKEEPKRFSGSRRSLEGKQKPKPESPAPVANRSRFFSRKSLDLPQTALFNPQLKK